MKQHFLKFASLFTVCLFVLTACEKEAEINAPDSLVGTSWSYEETNTEDGVEVKGMAKFEFTSSTKGELNIFVGGAAADEIVGFGMAAGEFSYTYSKPTVKITLDDETSTGTIDGNKLTLEGIVFVKE